MGLFHNMNRCGKKTRRNHRYFRYQSNQPRPAFAAQPRTRRFPGKETRGTHNPPAKKGPSRRAAAAAMNSSKFRSFLPIAAAFAATVREIPRFWAGLTYA
jgi:hypothetical protein